MNESILHKRPHLIPCVIAAVILLGALGSWPYGYYQLLRFVVCGVSVYVAFMAYNWHKLCAIWIAVLFNPLAPIHLSRELWQPIDMVSGVFFLVIGCVLKKSSEQSKSN